MREERGGRTLVGEGGERGGSTLVGEGTEREEGVHW